MQDYTLMLGQLEQATGVKYMGTWKDSSDNTVKTHTNLQRSRSILRRWYSKHETVT